MNDIYLNLPRQVANMALPDPELVTFFRDDANRVIWLEEEIEQTTLEIERKILQWNLEDTGKKVTKRIPIKIFFFSPGGSLDVNNSLVDTIKLSKTPVWGINAGQCCSAAAYIYLACHKRFALPQSYWVYHQGSGTFGGTFSEVCAQLAAYQEQVENLSQYMIDHTNYTKEEVEENITGEWYIFTPEAVEKGVCDKIVDDLDELFAKPKKLFWR